MVAMTMTQSKTRTPEGCGAKGPGRHLGPAVDHPAGDESQDDGKVGPVLNTKHGVIQHG